MIAEALDRGWDVTAFNRGISGATPIDVTARHVDRTSPEALAAALGEDTWDLVVDTWSGAPRVAGAAARALRGRAGRFGYVSSQSVYAWGTHWDESSPLVDGDPGAADGEYAALKRGAELAVLEHFPDALLARAGLILGPHEDIGRLPWWLNRIAAGGDVLAPGRPARPLQYVDVRDLAGWMLDALLAERSGPVDVVGPSGRATMRTLLEACIAATGSAARLVWVPEETLDAAGVLPWTQLPCWVPEAGEWAGFMESDTSLALALDLRCRPVEETVADTWRWLRREGAPPRREDVPVHGLPPELERRVLAAVGGRRR